MQQCKEAFEGLVSVDLECCGPDYPPGFEGFCGVVGPSPSHVLSEPSSSRIHGNLIVKGPATDQEKESSPYSDSESVDKVPTTPLFESGSFVQKEHFEEDEVPNEEDLVET